MKVYDFGDVQLHCAETGDPKGAPIVFANSLGTDFRLWDTVLPRLPDGLRIIRYDKRGHGLSSCPDAPYSMEALVRDAERLLDALEVKDCVFVGISVGGLIAQGLAMKRKDQVRGMVLSNTAAKIGTSEMWRERMEAIRKGGIAAMADAILERWFTKGFREGPEFLAWRNMLIRTPVEGYLGCSAAISSTDFRSTTAQLTLPTLAIAGAEDGATPPDLVRATAELVKGSRFHLIHDAGHLPCIEQPEEYAAVLTSFLKEIDHG